MRGTGSSQAEKRGSWKARGLSVRVLGSEEALRKNGTQQNGLQNSEVDWSEGMRREGETKGTTEDGWRQTYGELRKAVGIWCRDSRAVTKATSPLLLRGWFQRPLPSIQSSRTSPSVDTLRQSVRPLIGWTFWSHLVGLLASLWQTTLIVKIHGVNTPNQPFAYFYNVTYMLNTWWKRSNVTWMSLHHNRNKIWKLYYLRTSFVKEINL